MNSRIVKSDTLNLKYNAREILEIRGAWLYFVITAIASVLAALFQRLAGHSLTSVISTSVPFILTALIAFVVYKRKKEKKNAAVLCWTAAFISISVVAASRYIYALNIDWLYAAQSLHMYAIMMMSLISLQFFYDKKLFIFFTAFVFINWTVFMIAAHLNGLELHFDTFVNGKVNHGIVLSRQIYYILMMLIIAYLSYRNIPAIEKYDEMTENQKKKIQDQANEQHKMYAEVASMVSRLLIDIGKLKDFIINFNDMMQTQASTFEEISATLEELGGSAEGISSTAQLQIDESELMKNSMKSFITIKKDTDASLNMTVSQMQGVIEKTNTGREKIDDVITSINEIKELSEKISETTTLITDIADRINLLSLNASIEAARAGEHGRGFAVVADEIGKLANQTQDSIKEINQLLARNSEVTSSGVNIIKDASEIIKDLINSMRGTGEKLDSLTAYINQESEIIIKLSSNIEKNADLARNTGTGTTEQKAAIESTTIGMENANEVMLRMADDIETIAKMTRDITDYMGVLKEKANKATALTD